MKTQNIICRFIGDFKVGDNLVYNAGLLCTLLSSKDSPKFNKLIVLQAGAIIEASLAQIIYRAQNFNREGVPNILEADRQEIEGKNYGRFKAIIEAMKKYGILDGLGGDIYDELDNLREYRNKVHIQLDIGIKGVSRDEEIAFTNNIRDWVLELNLRLLNYLNGRFPRPKDLEQFAHEIAVPVP